MTTGPGGAWLDGRVLAAGAAAVPAADLGLRQGLGVFETLRVTDGRAAGLARHLDRLVAGGARLGIAVDAERARAGLAVLIGSVGPGDVVARITVTAGDAAPGWPPVAAGPARTLVTLHPAPPLPTPPTDAVVVPGPRAPAGLADVKTTSYAGSVVAQRAARARGSDVALIADGDDVLEAADGNVVAVLDGAVVTPPCDGRIIPGVTRSLLLELAPGLGLEVREAALDRRTLLAADLVAVTSSVRRLRPLRRIDGIGTAGGGAHPLLAALLGGLADVSAASDPIAEPSGR